MIVLIIEAMKVSRIIIKTYRNVMTVEVKVAILK